MYATGIGLVIVGIDRYEKEKEKLLERTPKQEEFVAVEDAVKVPRSHNRDSNFFKTVKNKMEKSFEKFFKEEDDPVV